MLQKYLDNYDLSIKVIYVLGTLGFSAGTAVMAMFPNVYVAMVTISTMGIVSMSISYCPYALLGHYHEIKEVRPSPGCWGRGGRKVALTQTAVHLCSQQPSAAAYLVSLWSLQHYRPVLPRGFWKHSLKGHSLPCFTDPSSTVPCPSVESIVRLRPGRGPRLCSTCSPLSSRLLPGPELHVLPVSWTGVQARRIHGV